MRAGLCLRPAVLRVFCTVRVEVGREIGAGWGAVEAMSQRAFEARLDLIVGVMEPLIGDKLEAGPRPQPELREDPSGSFVKAGVRMGCRGVGSRRWLRFQGTCPGRETGR